MISTEVLLIAEPVISLLGAAFMVNTRLTKLTMGVQKLEKQVEKQNGNVADLVANNVKQDVYIAVLQTEMKNKKEIR